MAYGFTYSKGLQQFTSLNKRNRKVLCISFKNWNYCTNASPVLRSLPCNNKRKWKELIFSFTTWEFQVFSHLVTGPFGSKIKWDQALLKQGDERQQKWNCFNDQLLINTSGIKEMLWVFNCSIRLWWLEPVVRKDWSLEMFYCFLELFVFCLQKSNMLL